MPQLDSANVTPVRVAASTNIHARGLTFNVEGAHFILNNFSVRKVLLLSRLPNGRESSSTCERVIRHTLLITFRFTALDASICL